MTSDGPAIQLIANVVATSEAGAVLLVQYGEGSEADDGDARWWLPACELEPYQHPDDAARAALAEVAGIEVVGLELAGVQSFRGRRGWHVSFDYRARLRGAPSADGELPAALHDPQALPRTAHGRWERDVVARVLGGASR